MTVLDYDSSIPGRYGIRNMQDQSADDFGSKRHLREDPKLCSTTITGRPRLLLQLPFEIRSHICSYLLPTTVEQNSKGIVWRRGNVAILAVNKQLYEEALKILYGNSTFVVDVDWDAISFKYQWLLPSGLVPSRTMRFPDDIAARNVPLIKRLHIRVHHVDSYTGMVKYNYGGHGLTDGLKSRVEDLCRVLKGFPVLAKLEIELLDGNKDMELGQTVLEPFSQLSNVHRATVSGPVAVAYARYLEGCMIRG
ncbi:MAG: hypothetical protein M1830_009421 [Pleopsidium flavum]|nr:MAG: hypothetical protein M1830_009421 [Pleopsidium flavum]